MYFILSNRTCLLVLEVVALVKIYFKNIKRWRNYLLLVSLQKRF